MKKSIYNRFTTKQHDRRAMFDTAYTKIMEIGHIVTTPYFWNCDCDAEYIHAVTQRDCKECGRQANDAPDARLDELFNLALRGMLTGQGDRTSSTDGMLDAAYERYMNYDLLRWKDE